MDLAFELKLKGCRVISLVKRLDKTLFEAEGSTYIRAWRQENPGHVQELTVSQWV